MGLLGGALDNDMTRFGLGLLAASGPTNDPQKGAFGSRLMQAVGSFDDYRQQKAQAERAKRQEEFQAFQMEQMKAQAMQQQAAMKREEAMRTGAAQFFKPSQTLGGSVAIPEMGGVEMFSQGAKIDAPVTRTAPSVDIPGLAAFYGQQGAVDKALPLFEKLQPKADDYKVVGNSLVQIGKGGVNPVFTEAQKPTAKPADIQGYELAKSEGYKGSYFDYQRDIKRAGATNVSLSNVGPKAFETELGKMDADQLGKWRDGALAAQSTLGSVQRLEDAAAKGAYSGGAANLKMTVGSYINGLTGATPKGQIGSELYTAEANNLVLSQVKALGANPSNADVIFIQKTVPQLSTNAEARTAMTEFMRRKAEGAIGLYQRANTHARKNSGLGGFEVVEPTGDIDSLVEKYAPRAK